jgi:hypothetical protein
MPDDPAFSLSRQCIPHDAPSPAANICFSTGSQLSSMSSSSCRGYTHTSLEGVSCIRFSCGSAARPREANEISGLWLEHFSEGPKIIGQWISEVERMDFCPGEEVAKITIWMSQLEPIPTGNFRAGRVVAISVSTAMQSKTVRLIQTEEDKIELTFQTNRLEKLVGSTPLCAFPFIPSPPLISNIRLYCLGFQ